MNSNRMTEERFKILKELSKRPATAIDLVSDRNVAVVQDLVRMGYATDFSAHAGHRIPVRLRIWGINSAGRAVLEQHALAAASTKVRGQLSLIVNPNKLKEEEKGDLP